MRFIIIFLSVFLLVNDAVFADCEDPHGTPGTIVFNDTHDVFQGCTKAGHWRAFHSNQTGGGSHNFADCMMGGQTVAHGESSVFYSVQEHTNCASVSQLRYCANGALGGYVEYQYASCVDACRTASELGALCPDGSFYIGEVDNKRIYAAAADEGGNIKWKYDRTTTTGTQNKTDGYANTYPALENTGHPAGYACATKSPAGTWYLPAEDELDLLWENRSAFNLLSKGFIIEDNVYYWASTSTAGNSSRGQRFTDGRQASVMKDSDQRARCVRR